MLFVLLMKWRNSSLSNKRVSLFSPYAWKCDRGGPGGGEGGHHEPLDG